MVIKLLEVRDRGTFIPCWAMLMAPTVHSLLGETYLLRRSGYGFDPPLILMGRLDGGECRYDPHSWRGGTARALPIAHRYVTENWDKLDSGDVVDVEFILGETTTPKESESESKPLPPTVSG